MSGYFGHLHCFINSLSKGWFSASKHMNFHARLSQIFETLFCRWCFGIWVSFRPYPIERERDASKQVSKCMSFFLDICTVSSTPPYQGVKISATRSIWIFRPADPGDPRCPPPCPATSSGPGVNCIPDILAARPMAGSSAFTELGQMVEWIQERFTLAPGEHGCLGKGLLGGFLFQMHQALKEKKSTN